MDTPMNTKIRTILAAGMLLVTVLPVAACAKRHLQQPQFPLPLRSP